MLRPDDLAPLFPHERVVAVSRRPHPYRTSHPIDELDVTFASGAELTVIAKDTGSLSQEAALARAGRAGGAGEAELYLRVLAPRGLPVPRLYGVAGGTLVLELVRGRPLWQVAELEQWQAAAAALADVHERTLGLDLPAAVARADSVAGLETACAAAHRILDRLPRVLVHGDCYPSNVLVRDDGGIAFVDWEQAAAGAGVLDLAALGAGWDEASAAAIAAAYEERSSWARALGSGPFRASLAAARLVVAARWLGAPASWRPPAEHAHDWRAEALAAAAVVA